MNKIFISSVIRNFEEFRQATKSAVELMGHNPIMSENFSARSYSSETACIHEVEQSDIYLVVIGEKYGFETEEGISVTHAEFRAAKNSNRSILALIQQCEKEEKQKDFKKEVESYSDGVFRASFNTPQQLKDEIIKALRQIETMEQAVSNEEFDSKITAALKQLSDGDDDNPEFVIGFLPQPERIVDIVSLENELDKIFEKMCKAGLASFRDGYDSIEESEFTGLKTGESKIGFFADGLILFITEPTEENSSLFANYFVPPSKLQKLAEGIIQVVDVTSAHVYIGLHGMGSAYVADPHRGSGISMRMWGKDCEEFTRLFLPVTPASFNDWAQHCINRFSRTFKYK